MVWEIKAPLESRIGMCWFLILATRFSLGSLRVEPAVMVWSLPDTGHIYVP